jgi:hypothetical protein
MSITRSFLVKHHATTMTSTQATSFAVMQSPKQSAIRYIGQDEADPSSTCSTSPIILSDLPDDVLLEIASHLPKTEPETVEALWDRVKPRHQRKLYRPPQLAQRDSDRNRSILALASVNKRFRQVFFPGWLIRAKSITECHGALLEGSSKALCSHVL